MLSRIYLKKRGGLNPLTPPPPLDPALLSVAQLCGWLDLLESLFAAK